VQNLKMQKKSQHKVKNRQGNGVGHKAFVRKLQTAGQRGIGMIECCAVEHQRTVRKKRGGRVEGPSHHKWEGEVMGKKIS